MVGPASLWPASGPASEWPAVPAKLRALPIMRAFTFLRLSPEMTSPAYQVTTCSSAPTPFLFVTIASSQFHVLL